MKNDLTLDFEGSKELKHLIKWWLTRNINERPRSVQDIMLHPFFKSINWENTILKKDPEPWVPSLINHFNKKLTKIPIIDNQIEKSAKQIQSFDSRASIYLEKINLDESSTSIYFMHPEGKRDIDALNESIISKRTFYPNTKRSSTIESTYIPNFEIENEPIDEFQFRQYLKSMIQRSRAISKTQKKPSGHFEINLIEADYEEEEESECSQSSRQNEYEDGIITDDEDLPALHVKSVFTHELNQESNNFGKQASKYPEEEINPFSNYIKPVIRARGMSEANKKLKMDVIFPLTDDSPNNKYHQLEWERKNEVKELTEKDKLPVGGKQIHKAKYKQMKVCLEDIKKQDSNSITCSSGSLTTPGFATDEPENFHLAFEWDYKKQINIEEKSSKDFRCTFGQPEIEKLQKASKNHDRHLDLDYLKLPVEKDHMAYFVNDIYSSRTSSILPKNLSAKSQKSKLRMSSTNDSFKNSVFWKDNLDSKFRIMNEIIQKTPYVSISPKKKKKRTKKLRKWVKSFLNQIPGDEGANQAASPARRDH